MRVDIAHLHDEIRNGSFLALAKGITIVENELSGYDELLLNLDNSHRPRIIGITGPPGAGKSTLVTALTRFWIKENKKIAVLAIDPSSPFNYGALLGDRIRMSEFYTHPNVYIRSLATRGALGGLNAKIIEITDLVKDAPFDFIIVETVGVGQSEVEIAGLADCTVVALVPETGDEVQTLKAGIMEIADIFVVNKADRDSADGLYHNLRILTHEKASAATETPVIKTVATASQGIDELAAAINKLLVSGGQHGTNKHIHLLAEKSWQLIQARRMKDIDRSRLEQALSTALTGDNFNLYAFTAHFLAERIVK